MTDVSAASGAAGRPATASDDPDVQELSHLMPALWRTLIRATRDSDRMPALESQVSILRRLSAAGRLSPAQLAEELHLARPTISNLLKGLVSEGIVARERSSSDGRSVWLTLTGRGEDILEGFRRGRAETLAEALDAIPADDRDLISAALPSFEVLLHQLEEMSGGEPV
jgi:DNA-binding MarR family transcriptional regulator